MSVPPSPPPLSDPQPPPSGQFQFQRAEPPQVPVTRATPERLVQLLVNIAGRLERLEGICSRMDDSIDRLERRFDSAECRWIGLNDSLHLLLMLVGNLPSLRQIALAVLAVMTAGFGMALLGMVIAGHLPGALTVLF